MMMIIIKIMIVIKVMIIIVIIIMIAILLMLVIDVGIWSWVLVHLCPGFLFIFLKFSFFGLLEGSGGGGVKGQKLPKMKNNNYICHMPYLKNSIAYNHDFWYTCVKWRYLQSCCFFFFMSFIFIFWAVRGVKRQKIAQNEKVTVTSVTCHIPGTV